VKMKLLLLFFIQATTSFGDQAAAASLGDQPAATSLGCRIEDGKDYLGNDIHHKQVETLQACADLCASTPGGLFWTWNMGKKKCFVKTSDSGRKQYPGAVSGNRECGDQAAAAPIGDQTTTTSEDDQTEGSGIGIDMKCHSNLFDEAVELLSTHTVERLQKQLLVKENALKEKETEVEMLKLKMEKSWTLVLYMMKVMSSSKEMIKSKEELVVAQAAKIEEMEKQVAEFSQMTEDTVRMMNTSHRVIEAQEKTIDELRKIVTEDSKLADTYRKLEEVNLLKTNCEIPPYLSVMTDSLSSQQEEISELKAVLQEEESVKILLSNITTEMESLNEMTQATEENQEVLGKCQELLRKQSSGLTILRTLASHAVTTKDSLQYEEDDDGQILSAELRQYSPEPHVNQTVSITFIRGEDTISLQWSSWQGCEGIRLPNGTNLECGEGTKVRRRLKDINLKNTWDEEVEEEQCPTCPQFPDQCFNYNELDSSHRARRVYACSNGNCCDGGGHSRAPSDWKGAGWYRVVGEAGTQLTTEGTSTCGTQAHGWLSGGHPAPGEGEVDRTVFFDDGSNDKRNPTSIKVVNCNDEYFVYYLPDVCGCVGGGCVSDLYSGYCTQ